MNVPYCSINHLVLIILMGCRQSFPERQLDTFIPMVTSNIVLPFKVLPVGYLLLCWVCAFLFELPIDFSLLGCMFFSWLYMRLFMITKSMPPNQIGDSTPGFALSTFFPERCAPWLDWLAKVGYKAANMCKLIDALQSCLKKRQIANAKAKAENRKKALKMLQNEISKKDEEVADGWACDDDEEDGRGAAKGDAADDGADLESAPASKLIKSTEASARDSIKTSSDANGSGSTSSASPTKRATGQSDEWKRRALAATKDLVTPPNKSNNSSNGSFKASASAAAAKKESEAVVKDEVDDDDEDEGFNEVEIRFEGDAGSKKD